MKFFETVTFLVLVGICSLSSSPPCGAADSDAYDVVIKGAVDKVAPSVVQIQTTGGRERIGRMLVGTGPTTGLIVSADGYILSSAFNFVQQPSSIVVVLPDGSKKAARLVARDRSRMLVMLKINVDQPLSPPVPVPRNELRVGQWAVAVGRTFESAAPNISIGILSAIDRIWSKAIQTDAKVSPTNYGGPLVDVEGRVFGILVPLSPQQQTEVAGAEWYDSGIGFAIPLVDLVEPIERLKKGENLSRGILGVTLKGSNMFADAAIVATSVRNSPAAKAGIKREDQIIEIDGQTISRQTHLKHALGPRYAGETVRVVVLRRAKRLEFDVELAARVDPYERPYFGILPMRDVDEQPGVGVRFVLPDSPAQTADLQTGDRIVSLDGESVASSEALRELLANCEPGQVVTVSVLRNGEEQSATIELTSEPDQVPEELPPRSETEPEDVEPQVVPLKVASEANECFALIPTSYDESKPHGVVIWLSAPNEFDEEVFVRRWANLCRQHELIVMAPQPNDDQRWVVTEAPIIAKLFKQLDRDYTIDAHRVVVHGYQGGASLAYRFAFENRNIVHGVAAVDAAVPLGVQVRGNDSIEHLAFWIHAGQKSPRARRVLRNIQRFRQMKFPVTEHVFDGEARYLDDEELGELARWVDIQDRI